MVGERTAAARMPVQARYPLISCSVGVSADIQLDSTAATSAPDPTEDVASQRCRCVAEDAEKRMAAMCATDALTPGGSHTGSRHQNTLCHESRWRSYSMHQSEEFRINSADEQLDNLQIMRREQLVHATGDIP